MKDDFSPTRDREKEELVKQTIKRIASMSPAEFAAFKELVKAEQPDIYELLFVESDHSEVDTKSSF